MAAHASTLTQPGNPDRAAVLWPPSATTTGRGWHGLASKLTAPNLDWTIATADLVDDAPERGTLFHTVGCLLESVSLAEFLTAALKVSDSLIPATTTGFDLLHPLTKRPLQIAARGGSLSFVRSYELTVRTHDTVLERVGSVRLTVDPTSASVSFRSG